MLENFLSINRVSVKPSTNIDFANYVTNKVWQTILEVVEHFFLLDGYGSRAGQIFPYLNLLEMM